MSRRFLLLTNFYPPHVKGGAELAAFHLGRWLARHGQEVGIFTLAAPGSSDSTVEEEPHLTVFRRTIPNLYYALEHLRAPGWKKPFWHLLDHAHPVAASKLREVLRTFRPDLANTHNLTGLGYNLWQVLGRAGLPVIVSCHDMTLFCLRQSMFKNGRNCATPCAVCRVSAGLRGHSVRHIERLLFMSPSRALLEALRPAFPAHAGALHLPYSLDYARRTEPKPESPLVQLLYAGQVSPHKGVPFLVEILDSLPDPARFRLTIVGGGSSLDPLRAQYGDRPWVEFAGFVPPANVEGFMRAADVLLVPSLWFENQPLVVHQARALGLPAMVSDQGGLPEMVADQVIGRILPAGDRAAWREALIAVTSDPAISRRWHLAALERRDEFSPDTLGARFLSAAEELLTSPCASS